MIKLKLLVLIAFVTTHALGQTVFVNVPPPPEKVDPKLVKCRELVSDLNKRFNLREAPNYFCSMMNMNKTLKAASELPACVDALIKKSSVRSDLVRTCLTPELRVSLKKNDDLAKCLDKNKNLGLGDDELAICRDPNLASKIQDPLYIECVNNHSEANPNYKLMGSVNACKNAAIFKNLTGTNFNACKTELKLLGGPVKDNANYCLSADHQAPAHIQKLKTCSTQVGSLIGDKLGMPYCLKSVFLLDEASEDLSCLKKANSFLDKDYYLNQNNIQSGIDLLEDLITGCLKNPAPVPEMTGELKFFGAKIFGQNTLVQNDLLGGLSGLSFDQETNAFVVISDDPGMRSQPRYFGMTLDLENGFDVTFDKVTHLKTSAKSSFGPRSQAIDSEGIVVLPNGDTVISSETLLPNSKSFHKIYDYKGEQIDEILLSEKFLPRDAKFEKEVKVKVPQQLNRPDLSFPPGPKPEVTEIIPVAPVYRTSIVTTWNQVQGILPNKGFESLTGNSLGTILYTANEEPLLQDELNSKDIVRIVKLVKDKNTFKTQAEYAYALDDQQDNGLVDMVYVSPTKLLTMERAYDSRKNKVTSKIFEVNLSKAKDYSLVHSFEEENDKAPIQTVSKKLLLNMDDILPMLPDAISKIDNIEGIALGPKLPNGNRSILLVSDNNFSSSQMTQVILLEYLTP